MDFVQNQQVKVLRAPSLKRGKVEERITDRIKLEKVLGVTVSTNAALDSCPNSDIVAYPAGCTVVLFNTQTGQQNHIINVSRKSITSLAFSSCGRYLVTGECGHQPAVRVWDLQSDPQYQQVAEYLSHKYGICCVAFSPSNKFVVSIGTQHDMIVNVWDWRSNVKVASNKVSTKVKALAFAENGSYFVTVGNRHVKFWFLEYGKAKYTEAVPLMGRSAILGVQRNNYFCDVACGKAQCGDSTYAITRSGLLCEFNNRRLLDKWVELRTNSANCIVVGEKYIFVGCAEGIVRCFDPVTLHFVTTLPRTHYLGVDVSSGLAIQHMSSPPPDAKYPDTIAVTCDETNNKLTCIYNDHSVYVWDVHNIKRVGKSHSFLFHSACIWGVEMAPPNSVLPSGSFLSCSSDDTIRLWTLDKLSEKNTRGIYQRNIYSDELLKVVYIDEDMTYLKDMDISTNNVSGEKSESSYDSRNGVRCVKLSPDGKHLASGDRAGNIRIHETSTMKEILKIEAHDAEVLCLEYSSLDHTDNKLLASASRDRLIHVFDVSRNYNFLQTLDDHSSSITAVRFLNTSHGNLQMVSCGADKCLIFRSLGGTPNGTAQFTRGHNATGKATLYDMEVDSGQKHVLTACQDRNVRIYSVGTGKHTKSFKGSTGDDGTLIKVALDRSGIYLATSCTDKSLSVYDYYTGECMATMCGHSELATGLRFTNDCKRLISASGDGCIFIWKVPHDMVVTMHARLSQQAMRQGRTLDSEIFNDGHSTDFYEGTTENNYRFSVGQLPQWARKQIPDVTSPPIPMTKFAPPKGRWAQRAEESIMAFYSADSVLPFPSLGDRRVDSDGSKDSSMDSGTETRQYHHHESFKQISTSTTTSRSSERRNLTDDSALGSLRDQDNESTAHDADIDSDHEYRLQPLYYPTQVDSASGSEFTVTNIDADELRKSMRKSKRNLPSAVVVQPTSISGSQESEDDDDEASTPSGENTDRNPMSFLSLSSESLDQLANREKYLQSTFESLSGAELESPGNKSSISAQYHTRIGTTQLRNISVINATRQAKNDPYTLKKREELSKMIADTKKKLANVGHNSPLKYSKSIHDLSHIPEKDKWGSPHKPGRDTDDSSSMEINAKNFPYAINDTDCLQLCGCHFLADPPNRNPTNPNVNLVEPSGLILSDVLNKSPERNVKNLAAMIKPRKLQLDKTLIKYKMHKSLPVSPVNEEVSFSDFVQKETQEFTTRRSFSYFVDFKDETNKGFREICQDIEKFSQDFLKQDFENDDGNFSSDSLEECSFNSSRKKSKNLPPPRRCVSNNEIYKYQEQKYTDFYHHDCEIPKSFYLNPSNKNSQDSIVSEDNLEFCSNKSYCNSLESVLSNDSDCKSAPLEILFSPYRKIKSLPKNHESSSNLKRSHTFTTTEFARKNVETQTDSITQEEKLIKKPVSLDFQKKLQKFENITKPKAIAFFVDTEIKEPKDSKTKKEKKKDSRDTMHIPSLETKNKQYQSKYRNVLNNKPEFNIEIYESGSANKQFTLTNLNFERNRNQIQETSSLDRHLLSKGLIDAEKVCHKPPKAVRRHSSRTRKKTYEYIKKEDFYKNNKNNNCSNENIAPSPERTIEFNYKEKNIEKECENGNLLTELYDSLDKPLLGTNKIDFDSLEINLNTDEKLYDSLEMKNLWNNSDQDKLKLSKTNTIDRIQSALENIKILNEIQKKIQTINNLVDIFKRNITKGKVKALSSMYESMTNSKSVQNDLSCYGGNKKKVRRRNLSLPNFVERRLNCEARNETEKNSMEKDETKNNETKNNDAKNNDAKNNDAKNNDGKNNDAKNNETKNNDAKNNDEKEVHIGTDNLDTNLRRSCSLSDLSMQAPTIVQPKRKIEQVSGKLQKSSSTARVNSKHSKAVLTKSSSTSALNQSDSEPEIVAEKKVSSRLMRPTISSLNKLANVKPTNMTRKRHSHSVMNLRLVGNGDTSSEDEAKIAQKPIVPPRTRNLADSRKVNSKETLKPLSLPKKQIDVEDLNTTLTNVGMDSENLDFSTVQLSTHLCDEVALQLTRAANNVVELYRRLIDAEPNASSEHIANVRKTDMVKILELSISKTQKMLQDLTLERIQKSNGNVDVNQTDKIKALKDLVSKGITNDQDTFVKAMQQYSDILVTMMQQKIQNE